MLQTIGDIGHEKTDLVAAVVSGAAKFQPEEGLLVHELDHGVGNLDLATGTFALPLDPGKNLGLKNVTARNDQIGRGRLTLGLFDHARDLERIADVLAAADDTVAMHLVPRHLLNRDDVAARLGINIHHLPEAARLTVDQHVGQQQSEWLFTHDRARAPNGMAKPQRLLLAGETHLTGTRQIHLQAVELDRLAAQAQRVLKLILLVEMIFDDGLVTPGDKDKMLDARFTGLVNGELNHRAIDDGQHFLRHGFGRGQETGAETRDWKNSLPNPGFHGIDVLR